ncbi:MAG: hypothetical protein HY459_01780 [Parcubacteria group bacterium]|nr:hypothetical protein [Parcubacteria group bacterium]
MSPQNHEPMHSGQMTIDDLAKKMDTSFENLRQMINNSFNGVEEGFKQVDKRFDAVDQRFDRLEKKVDNLSTRMKFVEHDVGEIKDSLDKVVLPRVRRIGHKLNLGDLAPESEK